jgi:hypothetical protein
MQRQFDNAAVSFGPQPIHLDPHALLEFVGGRPEIAFAWRPDTNGKRRLIGNPNKASRNLHLLFGQAIRNNIEALGEVAHRLKRFPSATGCVQGSNPVKNILKHKGSQWFYITDLVKAYPSVDLERLAALLVFILQYDEHFPEVQFLDFPKGKLSVQQVYDDPLFPRMHEFLKVFFGGLRGEGLAVGGPLSPYLLNLYCEVYLDTNVRFLCQDKRLTYTRYVDDLAISGWHYIGYFTRKKIRELIEGAGFAVNHRKSRVQARSYGKVSITKLGLEDPLEGSASIDGRLVYSQKKRRKLHRLIDDYLMERTDWPEKVSGYAAEFLHYYKTIDEPTATDEKTFALCKQFEEEWRTYDHRLPAWERETDRRPAIQF